MITYAWSFSQFDVVPTEGSFTDVVKTIYWCLKATDAAYTTEAYGTVGLGPPDPSDFIAFADLTPEWTVTLVGETVDIPELEAALAAQIAALKNPPVVPMAPPFGD
jgi:hypothetical protein